jgi:hypothetical protein
MTAYGGVDVQINIFLTSALVQGGQLHAPAALSRGKARRTLWVGVWVDPRASLDDVEKRNILTLPGLEL